MIQCDSCERVRKEEDDKDTSLFVSVKKMVE